MDFSRNSIFLSFVCIVEKNGFKMFDHDDLYYRLG